MDMYFWNRNKFVTMLGLGVFLSGLALFAYLGYYNRYWADDWCYNADFSRLGFLGTMKGYTYITTYASNRFSLTLFSGLLYFLGVPGIQMMTLLVVIFWTWGLYRLLNNVNVMASSRFSTAQILLVTAIVIYYSIYLAPHLYQSVYWRSGLLPYTAPLVFGVWTLAWITSRAMTVIHERPFIGVTAILSFIGGGFSESGNATLTAVLVAYVVACLVYKRKKWANDTLPIAVVALVASVTAMAVLITSPTNAYRLGLYERPVSLVEFPRLLSYHAFEFLVTSVLEAPLPHIVVFGTLLLAGALAVPSGDRRIKATDWFLLILLIAVFTFVFIAASYAPSTYIEQAPPAPRTRVIAQFLFILGYGLIAFVSGTCFRQYIRWRQLPWIIPVLLILFYSYGVYSVVLSTGKASLYAERAAIWDERDMQIRQSKEQGIFEVHVRGIDGLPVGGIRDFVGKHGPGFWVNNCAIRYYGVEAIYATLP